MIGSMCYVVLVLSFAVLGNAQTPTTPSGPTTTAAPVFNKTCGQLPRVSVPLSRLLVGNSPYIHDYTTLQYRCPTSIFTNPVRGTTDYDGTYMHMQGGSYGIIYDFKISCDKQGLDMTVCNSGRVQTWYFAGARFNIFGGFFCMYRCLGNDIQDFHCATNNATEFSADEERTVALTRGIKSAENIKKPTYNCFNNDCKAFY